MNDNKEPSIASVLSTTASEAAWNAIRAKWVATVREFVVWARAEGMPAGTIAETIGLELDFVESLLAEPAPRKKSAGKPVGLINNAEAEAAIRELCGPDLPAGKRLTYSAASQALQVAGKSWADVYAALGIEVVEPPCIAEIMPILDNIPADHMDRVCGLAKHFMAEPTIPDPVTPTRKLLFAAKQRGISPSSLDDGGDEQTAKALNDRHKRTALPLSAIPEIARQLGVTVNWAMHDGDVFSITCTSPDVVDAYTWMSARNRGIFRQALTRYTEILKDEK